MHLEAFTKDYIAELASWFQEPVEGNKFIDYYKDPEEWLKLVESRPERRAFIATESGQIIGFVDVEFDNDSDVLFAFGVKPELRGKGFGRKLLNEVVDYGQVHNAKTIRGGVEKKNIACSRLLESAGFSPTVHDDELTRYIKQLT